MTSLADGARLAELGHHVRLTERPGRGLGRPLHLATCPCWRNGGQMPTRGALARLGVLPGQVTPGDRTVPRGRRWRLWA